MKYWIWIIPALALLVGCSASTQEPPKEKITEETQVEEKTSPTPKPTTISPAEGNFEPAPELANDIWLNTEETLRLANLRGKVVLLDMWTFG